MKELIGIICIAMLLILPVGWAMNIYKLTQCDFEAPYMAETIHVIGTLPVVGGVVGWMDFGII